MSAVSGPTVALTRRRRHLPRLLLAALLVTACLDHEPPPLLFEQEEPGGTLWVLAVPAGTGLPAIDAYVPHRLRDSGDEGFIYRNYRAHHELEPVAVYRDGEVLYYDPQHDGAPPPESAHEPVLEPRRVQLPTRVGAICRDGWRSSSTGSGTCAGHRGVAQWLHAEAIDRGTVMATICPDRRLRAGIASCRGDAAPLARIRLADWQELSATSQPPRFSELDLDRSTLEVGEMLNDWIECDIGIRPFRVVSLPSLDRLPDDPWEVVDHLPPEHRSLLLELGMADPEVDRGVNGFDLLQHCWYHSDGEHGGDGPSTRSVAAVADRYFRPRILESIEGYGSYDGPYPFAFEWRVLFDPQDRLLYSFVLDLHETD